MKRSGNLDGQDQRITICEVVSIARVMRLTRLPSSAPGCGSRRAAAGGVGDGRGLAAALMLGADGVLVGTRFYASQEAAGLPAAKSRMVTATGDRTIRGILFDIVRRNVWPAPYSGRVLQNDFAEKWRGREAELLQHQDQEAARYAAARAAGDFDTAAVIAGEVV
jgi:nitronate monooxygenase